MIESDVKITQVAPTKVMTKRKRSEHYVNNKEFLAALIEYKKQIREAAEKEIPGITEEQLKTWKSPNKPRITNYLGECFLKIATHLSYKTNFINYIFIDDMISDGIENCVQYIHNFNPEKSQNPFAYFTQIIHYAFLRRIQREKRQLEIKNKILEKTGYDEVFVDDNQIDGGNYSDYNSIKENVHIKLRY
jgi:DNA-directed RNA polymerase specialized sigma subunit